MKRRTRSAGSAEELKAELETKPIIKKSITPPRPKKRKHIAIESEKIKGEAPPHWKEIYTKIEQMRSEVQAPVDIYGCERLSDKGRLPQKISRFHSLVSLMLSAQTKDQITADAMDQLAILCGDEFGPEDILAKSVDEIDRAIKKVGFHNRKALFIQQTSKILKDKYECDIPPTLEEVLELPGVGPKMAHILMNVAWDKPLGIGVDVHVHRISNRLKWVQNTKNPEQTRMELESWLPKEHWGPINKLLVGFGQTICTPLNTKCDICKINDLCPSAFKESKMKRPKLEKTTSDTTALAVHAGDMSNVDFKTEVIKKEPKEEN
jgi:endonuclease-3